MVLLVSFGGVVSVVTQCSRREFALVTLPGEQCTARLWFGVFNVWRL